MKDFILNNSIVNIWKEANSPLEYLVALWITGLFLLAIGGLSTILVATILNQHMWDNVQFGIYDTLGS